MENEIRDLKMVLEVVNQAYVKRDLNSIDQFMKTLFEKDGDATIVGTSNQEWCLTYEEMKDLFLSDWEYWGDVRIKQEEAIINEYGNYSLIYVPATLKYTFKSNDEIYARYLNSVKNILEVEKPNEQKLTKISWILSHLLSPRDSSERTYLFDLRISFILFKKDFRWYVKHMQFSVPTVGFLPDERLDQESFHDKEYLEFETKVKEYIAKINKLCEKEGEIKDLFHKFILSFNENKQEIDVKSMMNQYFSKSINIIDIDNQKYNFSNGNNLIYKHHHLFDKINFSKEKTIIKGDNNVAWIISDGIFEKKITKEEAFLNTVDNINEIFNRNISDREKLFKIRRNIVEAMKENAKGENYLWPFRFEGFLVKENGIWKFTYIQFSLPFGYILEGKTEAAILI